MKEQATLTKVGYMIDGKPCVMSADELDLLYKFDVSNVIRSKPSKTKVGKWECWIERRDITRMAYLSLT